MTAQVAAMLDELMGKHRNVDLNKNPKGPSWEDDEICKHFLVDYCPYDLFTNTKSDLGVCKKFHDEKLKAKYMKSSRYGKMGYEEQFTKFLQGVQSDMQRRIDKNRARLELTQPSGEAMHAEQEKAEGKIAELSEKINVLIVQAEELGAEGKVEEAQKVIKMCDELKDERLRFIRVTSQQQQSSQQVQTMEVCDTCGCFLITGDPAQRMDEHFVGKKHLGYAKIAETIKNFEQRKIDERKKELEDQEKAKEERDKKRKAHDQKDDEKRSKRKERDRERKRSRSRSRSRSSRSRHHHNSGRDYDKRTSDGRTDSRRLHSGQRDGCHDPPSSGETVSDSSRRYTGTSYNSRNPPNGPAEDYRSAQGNGDFASANTTKQFSSPSSSRHHQQDQIRDSRRSSAEYSRYDNESSSNDRYYSKADVDERHAFSNSRNHVSKPHRDRRHATDCDERPKQTLSGLEEGEVSSPSDRDRSPSHRDRDRDQDYSSKKRACSPDVEASRSSSSGWRESPE